jgi:hypothetical protein
VPTEPLIVTFGDVSTAEANRLAGTLADVLRDVHPSIVVRRQRQRADTQELGGGLEIILGTATLTAVAKGIAAWMGRHSGVRLKVWRNGKLVLDATNLDSKDVARTVEAISRV